MKLLDFPDLRQITEYDCGATALEAIFAYYGFDIREEKIIKEAHTNHEHGTSVTRMENTAKLHGLSVDSRQMDIADIKNYLDKNIPVILLLQTWHDGKPIDYKNDWQDGHFVVAIGYDDEKIIFEDPSSFVRTSLTYSDLLARWHDIDEDTDRLNHGIAIYGRKPAYHSGEIIKMG